MLNHSRYFGLLSVDPVKEIGDSKEFQRAYESFDVQIPDLIDLIVKIQQIPSPTFEEKNKAIFVRELFEKIGLSKVETDSLNNVYGTISGSVPSKKTLVISAHIDTVFDTATDLSVRQDGPFLFGPGIGDNSSGVAAIIMAAKMIKNFELATASDLWFVANVGEEGMGDLRGMRAVYKKFGAEAQYIVVEGGSLGQVIYNGIGVQRFRIAIKTPGGHSWGSYGEPNAIHELSQIVTKISSIPVPEQPKTTFNVGVIEGGTTVNSIASSASLLLDLRSEDKRSLDKLVSEVRSIINNMRLIAEQQNKKIVIEMDRVGFRPAGHIDSNHLLVSFAESALRYVGWGKVNNDSGSTDANIPLSNGAPAVCVGLTKSGNSHRLDEYIEIPPLKMGLRQLMLLILAAANY